MNVNFEENRGSSMGKAMHPRVAQALNRNNLPVSPIAVAKDQLQPIRGDIMKIKLTWENATNS